MPDGLRKKPLKREIQDGRRVFYGRLSSGAGDAAARLDKAYQTRLAGVTRAIDTWAATDRQIDALYNLKRNIQRELDTLQAEIINTSYELQRAGAQRGYMAGLGMLQRGGVNVAYHLPTIEAIQASIGYVDSPAWRAAVERLGAYHADQAADLVLDAMARGVNPRQTAVWLRDYFVKSRRPGVDALRMARTTQLYAAREGARQIYERTGISEWIWSANLGNPRTCLSCIVLHGRRFPVSQILNDHHNGRCAPVPITPTWRELGLEGGRDVEIETGIDWFMRQSADAQQKIMGPGMFRAWAAGEFRLQQIPRLYHNDIFGPMWRKSTLTELLNGGPGGAVDGDGWPIVPTPDGGPGGGPIDAMAAAEAANRASYERAKAITPELLDSGTAGGGQADYMYNFFAYDSATADPVFDAAMLGDAKTDLLYDVYTLGRGRVDLQVMHGIREKAGALLAGDDWLSGAALSRSDRNLLLKLASADDDQALAAIDSIRDRRLKGALAYRSEAASRRGASYDSGYTGAAEADAIERLRELNAPQWRPG